MNLNSGLPFWLIKYGLPCQYPKLESAVNTDVLIIGGGITGALVSHYLINVGMSCMVADRRTIGLGSTCASTSLVQYELDIPLCDLAEKIGKGKAVKAYQLCRDAISKLAALAKNLQFGDFENKDSFYFAAKEKDVEKLKQEFKIRKENGFDVEYLDEDTVKSIYKIKAPGGILSKEAALTNAYLFTHAILQDGISKGLKVYDRTEIKSIKHERDGVKATTAAGHIISAKKIVYAVGYEAVKYLPKKITTLLTTYATVSESTDINNTFKDNNLMLWNTANPYLYMRPVGNRIMIGGRDESFSKSSGREKLIHKKASQLIKDFNKVYPSVSFVPEFSWAGTFGVTEDSLPYIGPYKKVPNCLFALGYGGNGIAFSLIAAELICDLLQGKNNQYAKLFSFERI